MEWTKEQEQAIHKKESNILVAAAAGSGKTAVLVERIINKIINENVDIDKILVVTFTNAAAAEMRERILKALYKKIDECKNQEEQENLQKQTILLNKASICTIDSFCLDVIRNNFFEMDISPNFRVGDTTEMELLKQEILEEMFEEKYENKDEDFQDLIKIYTSYRDDTPLKDLILKIFTYISSNPYPKEWLTDQIEKFNIKDKNIDFSKTIWGEILLNEIKEELIDDISKLKNEARKLSVESDMLIYQKTLENDAYELEIMLQNIESWDKAYTIANSIEFITWPRNKVNSVLAKENAKKVRDTIKKKFKEKTEKIFVSSSEDAVNDICDMYEILNKLKNLIFEFEQRFLKRKKEKNILDFCDIEHMALQILVTEKEDGKHTRTDVAKKYQQKFEEIAIDEYQDSNLVQEYILTSVSRENNIFMVGDVKQSIYKFRQAMPELFLSKYKTYSLENANNNGLKIQLFKNFRSRENVLEFTNIIFQNIMSQNLGDIDYTEEEYLNLGSVWDIVDGISTPKKIKNEIDIINLKAEEKQEETEDEEVEKIENIELEAKFVAQKIKEIIESKQQVYDLKEKKYRDIKYKDIVILLRSTKGKAPVYESELMKLDIPVYSDMSSVYIDSIEIQTILSLLKIIDNPMQDIPLVMVMRSSIGKFTDNELVEIRLADKYSDFYTTLLKAKISVSNELRLKIEEFLNKIEKWREEQEYLGLDELIWNIYEDTGFLNYVGILPNGELRQANLRMLFERAKQYETASFKGLFNFIRFIEKLNISSSDLSSAKMIGENEDVVRIMSIHKSKGLEFPVVFLSSSSTDFNLRDLNNDILLNQNLGLGVKYINYDMQIKYDTLTKLALKNIELISTLSEEMRILYVALTRAKEKIYITGLSKDFEKEKLDKQELLGIYKSQEKINPILVKKYKNYLDWIELVYFNDEEKMKQNVNFNIYSKNDIIKSLKPEEKEEIDILKFLQENSEDVTDEEIRQIEKSLNFKYEFEDATAIPTKTSITAIAHKDILNKQEDEEIEFTQPQFLKGDIEEKVTSARKGIIIHLCMKNLDFSKEYNFNDIKNMLDKFVLKNIITEKEAKCINISQILKFTKSDIWQELKQAKAVYKEEPFYINVPANEIFETDNTESVLAQGIIDLYFIDKNGDLILLDYKTDFVNQGEEIILIERHKEQLFLYKKALEDALNKKVKKVLIYSTVLGKIVEI